MRRSVALALALVLGFGCARHFVVKPEQVKARGSSDWTIESVPAGKADDSGPPAP